MEYLSLFVKSIFVDNMIFAYFLGMCSYLAVSKNVKTANGLGLAVIFVLVCTLPLNYLLNKYILTPGENCIFGPDVDLDVLSGLELEVLAFRKLHCEFLDEGSHVLVGDNLALELLDAEG